MSDPVTVLESQLDLRLLHRGKVRDVYEVDSDSLLMVASDRISAFDVVLPNAITGILTGVILEVSRTAGETAPIMFTGAAFFLPFLPQSVFDQTMAMSLHLFVISTQVPGVPEEMPYAVALVLIAMVLTMNAISIAFRMYLRGKKKW